MILSQKNLHFGNFYKKNYSKIHKIVDFGCKKPSNFDKDSKINTFSLVPQIDHPVALCYGLLA